MHLSSYVMHMAQIYSCMPLVRVSKLVFDHLFTDIGSIDLALALEVPNKTSEGSRSCKNFIGVGGGTLGARAPPPQPVGKGGSAPTDRVMPIHSILGLI